MADGKDTPTDNVEEFEGEFDLQDFINSDHEEDVIEGESEEVTDSEDEDDIDQLDDEPETDPEIDKARAGGHVSKEEWVAQGKDPDDWVSARRFNERGSMIDTIKSLQEQTKTFDKRLENVNTLAMLQLQQVNTQLQQLEQEKREAIELGDVDLVEQLQGQINTGQGTINLLNNQIKADQKPQGVPADVVQLETDWNSRNPWINTTDPTSPDFGKAHFAQGLYANLLQQGVSPAVALQHVDRTVLEKFPPVNPRRKEMGHADSSKPKGTASKGKTLSWSDLSHDEIKLFNGMAGAWTKEEFLQTVADSRKTN